MTVYHQNISSGEGGQKSELPTDLTKQAFSITAPVGSDTWRAPAPGAANRASSPFVYNQIPLAALRRVQVTVQAAWEAQYDQAGLMLALPRSSKVGTTTTATPTPTPTQKVANGEVPAQHPLRWIKAGLEVVGGVRHASVVTANPYADWSLMPLDPDAGHGKFKEALAKPRGSLTIGMERVLAADTGLPKAAMWIYLVLPDGSRQNLRELTWVFESTGQADDQQAEAWIGVFAARPKGIDGSDEPLEVDFEGFELETA